MLYYMTLFVGILYFKIFRVYRQQEKMSIWRMTEGTVTILMILILMAAGFMTQSWYDVLIGSIVSAVMASLMITTVQLGIFIDGKPLFKLSSIYKVMPLLALFTLTGTMMTLISYYLAFL